MVAGTRSGASYYITKQGEVKLLGAVAIMSTVHHVRLHYSLS